MAVIFPNVDEMICQASELTGFINYPDPNDVHAYRYPNTPDPILFYYLETLAIEGGVAGRESLDLSDWLRRRSELGYPISEVKWPVKCLTPNLDLLNTIRKYSELVI